MAVIIEHVYNICAVEIFVQKLALHKPSTHKTPSITKNQHHTSANFISFHSLLARALLLRRKQICAINTFVLKTTTPVYPHNMQAATRTNIRTRAVHHYAHNHAQLITPVTPELIDRYAAICRAHFSNTNNHITRL